MDARKLFFGGSSLVLAASLLSADLVRDSYDLTPKFTEGQKIRIENEITFVVGLDDAAASFAGQELPADVTLDVEMEMTQVMNEEILGASDGAITKMRRSYDTMGMNVTGEAGAMGQLQSIDESEEIPLEGRTLELTVDEDGNVEVTDVTEDDDSVDEATQAMIKTQMVETHSEALLPRRAVEVGDSWDVAEASMEMFEKMAGSQGGGDADMARMMEAMKGMMEQAEIDATGRLVSVEGDLANIAWTMSFELSIDDLFEMIRDFADPEMTEDMPEDAEGMIEIVVEAKGTGVFDLKKHQLVSMEMEGEYSMSAEMAMSQDGMEMNGNADLSGTMEMTTTLTIE